MYDTGSTELSPTFLCILLIVFVAIPILFIGSKLIFFILGELAASIRTLLSPLLKLYDLDFPMRRETL